MRTIILCLAISLLAVTASARECTVENPCNAAVYNRECPAEWMGHRFTGSYQRHIDTGFPEHTQQVCDYEGAVTQAQCSAEGAMSNAGPHGEWCQKWINNETVLLSLARKS